VDRAILPDKRGNEFSRLRAVAKFLADGPEDRQPVIGRLSIADTAAYCFVYCAGDRHPADCPEPPVRSGWRRDGTGSWCVVDACARHGVELRHGHWQSR
jgi:hypothetical protein